MNENIYWHYEACIVHHGILWRNKGITLTRFKYHMTFYIVFYDTVPDSVYLKQKNACTVKDQEYKI